MTERTPRPELTERFFLGQEFLDRNRIFAQKLDFAIRG